MPHNCFGPPFLFAEGLLSTGPTPSSFYFLVEMGLPLHLFSAYRLWELDQLLLKIYHHKDLKLTKLCLGPIPNLTQIFLLSKYFFLLKRHEDLLLTGKSSVLTLGITGSFSENTKFWRYAELNHFWVGRTKLPLYEVGQQERSQGCIRNKCVVLKPSHTVTPD